MQLQWTFTRSAPLCLFRCNELWDGVFSSPFRMVQSILYRMKTLKLSLEFREFEQILFWPPRRYFCGTPLTWEPFKSECTECILRLVVCFVVSYCADVCFPTSWCLYFGFSVSVQRFSSYAVNILLTCVVKPEQTAMTACKYELIG